MDARGAGLWHKYEAESTRLIRRLLRECLRFKRVRRSYTYVHIHTRAHTRCVQHSFRSGIGGRRYVNDGFPSFWTGGSSIGGFHTGESAFRVPHRPPTPAGGIQLGDVARVRDTHARVPPVCGEGTSLASSSSNSFLGPGYYGPLRYVREVYL